MGRVDLHDQHCNKLTPIVQSKKWTWVIFIRLLQVSITNATVFYNAVNESKKKLGTSNTSYTQNQNSWNIWLKKKFNVRTLKCFKECKAYFYMWCFEEIHYLTILNKLRKGIWIKLKSKPKNYKYDSHWNAPHSGGDRATLVGFNDGKACYGIMCFYLFIIDIISCASKIMEICYSCFYIFVLVDYDSGNDFGNFRLRVIICLNKLFKQINFAKKMSFLTSNSKHFGNHIQLTYWL